MKVFKFGGASVNSVERIKNVAAIMKDFTAGNLVVIVSAMGKTTNALEKVAEAFYDGRNEEALQLFNVVKQGHLNTAKYLLVLNYNKTLEQLMSFFTEVEWLLHDKPVKDFDYYYDQVVCVGELLSSCIVSAYLNEAGISNKWLDVRDMLRTDDNFRDAKVDFAESSKNIQAALEFKQYKIYFTQGFIGSTDENERTSHGREGSDYSAAIFANILNAESLTIWKDVEGVMSADPKQFNDASLINELSFTEVIEMAYYGAQVIHPKTIKPLQNKNIPLHVKSFIKPNLKGTIISSKGARALPPIIVVKENQVLLHLHSPDFSFVGEQLISRLYEIFAVVRIQPNLIQTGAISLQVCLDNRKEKVEHFASLTSNIFDVQLETGLTLLTIRHYNEQLLQNMTEGRDVVLIQKTKETVQVLYK